MDPKKSVNSGRLMRIDMMSSYGMVTVLVHALDRVKKLTTRPTDYKIDE